jgi:hypothetical protein
MRWWQNESGRVHTPLERVVLGATFALIPSSSRTLTPAPGRRAAKVLTRFFGTDHISFRTCSLTLPPGSTCTDPTPVLRSYTSFSQAAAENGLSRILNGFHFRKAVDEGIEHFGEIGNRAVDRLQLPAN